MASELIMRPIGDALRAHEEFGSQPGLIVARPSRACTAWFTVPEGYYALVTKNGGRINDPATGHVVWSSGFHYGMPWTRISHLVTKRHIVFDTPCKDCKSLDNVTIQIDVAVVFRIMGDASIGEDPENVYRFVHNVTPFGLQNQLRDAIDESCRVLARSMKHREVYGLRNLLIHSTGDLEGGVRSKLGVIATEDVAGIEMSDTKQDDDDRLLVGEHDTGDAAGASRAVFRGQSATQRMIKVLNRQFEAQGVKITDVMITDVSLPQEITRQMESKTMVISTNAQEIMTQQYEMQELMFSEELKLMEQTHKEEREQEKEDSEKRIKEIEIRLRDLRAVAEKSIRTIESEGKATVQSLRAESDLEITKLIQERNRITTELNTESKAIAAQLTADAELYTITKLSEADLIVAKNDAAAAEIIADAEGKVAPLLQAFNQHETNNRKLEVFASLAANSDFVVTPAGNPELQTLALCDAILSSNKSEALTRSTVLAELMLMRSGAQVALDPKTGATILAAGGGK